jgi:alanine racemase
VTIPVGYGDGLRRCLSNKGIIIYNGKRYPIVGNVCMDQFMVDLSTDPGYVGDVVTLMGADNGTELSIYEMSRLCNTHPYEILCGFNDRLPRVYL